MAECGPCDNFTLDMLSQQFGMCKCGHPRSAHSKKKKGQGSAAKSISSSKKKKKKKKSGATSSVKKTAKAGENKTKTADASSTKKSDKTAVTTSDKEKSAVSATESSATEVTAKKPKTAAAPRAEKEKTACAPCDNFRLDMHSQQFGMCVCGFSRAQHGSSSVRKSAPTKRKKKRTPKKKTETPTPKITVPADKDDAHDPLSETPRSRADSVHSVGTLDSDPKRRDRRLSTSAPAPKIGTSASDVAAPPHAPLNETPRSRADSLHSVGTFDTDPKRGDRRLSTSVPTPKNENVLETAKKRLAFHEEEDEGLSSPVPVAGSKASRATTTDGDDATKSDERVGLGARRSDSLKGEIAKALVSEDFDRVSAINEELMRRKRLESRSKESIKAEMAKALSANDFESVQRLNRELLARTTTDERRGRIDNSTASATSTLSDSHPPLCETPRGRAHSVTTASSDETDGVRRAPASSLIRPSSVRDVTVVDERSRRLSHTSVAEGETVGDADKRGSGAKRTDAERAVASEKVTPLLALGPPFSRALRGTNGGADDSASSAAVVAAPSSLPVTVSPSTPTTTKAAAKTPSEGRRRSVGRKKKGRRVKSTRVNAAFLAKLNGLGTPGGFKMPSSSSPSSSKSTEDMSAPSSSPQSIESSSSTTTSADCTKILGSRAVMKRSRRRRAPRRRKFGASPASVRTSEPKVVGETTTEPKDAVAVVVEEKKTNKATEISTGASAAAAAATPKETEAEVSNTKEETPVAVVAKSTMPPVTRSKPKKAAIPRPVPLGSDFAIPANLRHSAHQRVRRAAPRKTKCVHCKARHNSHSRECTECGISYCRTCKKKFMVKAAKKTWSCAQGFGCRKKSRDVDDVRKTTSTTTGTAAVVKVAPERPSRPITLSDSGRETPKKVLPSTAFDKAPASKPAVAPKPKSSSSEKDDRSEGAGGGKEAVDDVRKKYAPRMRRPTPTAAKAAEAEVVAATTVSPTRDDESMLSSADRDASLFRAVAQGDLESVRTALADRGASEILKLRNKAGESVLEVAESRRRRHVVALLKGETAASTARGDSASDASKASEEDVPTVTETATTTMTTTTTTTKKKKKKKKNALKGKLKGRVSGGFLAKLSGLKPGGFGWSAKSLREAKEKKKQQQQAEADTPAVDEEAPATTGGKPEEPEKTSSAASESTPPAEK